MSGYQMRADQQQCRFQNAVHYEGLYRPGRSMVCANTQWRVIDRLIAGAESKVRYEM